MKELGCKRLISWKRGCKGDVPLPFAKKKKRMSFGGLEHHNKLLEAANLIIVSCQRRR
jgi:hypothetical protein